MIRVSKPEIDLYVSRLKKQGQVVEKDYKVGRNRIIETDKVRITFKPNGWADIQNK